jgi:hypothetical protein
MPAIYTEFTWRGLWPQPNPKHHPPERRRTRIRNPKQIRITETQNSKQTITSYFDGGYGRRIPISNRKNKKSKDCITKSLNHCAPRVARASCPCVPWASSPMPHYRTPSRASRSTCKFLHTRNLSASSQSEISNQ